MLKARSDAAARNKMLNSTSTCTGTDVAGVINQTCATVYAESTSTDPTYYNGFSAGEIVQISLDFLIFTTICVIAYHVLFRKFKIKNQ